VVNRRSSQLGVFFVPGEVDQFVRPGEKHRLQDALLDLRRRLGLIELRELRIAVHHAELANRVAAQRRILLGFRQRQQPSAIAGSARSESLCISALSAYIFSSSSFCASGETVWPDDWRMSISSAFASFIHRLSRNPFSSSDSVVNASVRCPILFCAYAFQYSAASVRFDFSSMSRLKRSTACSYRPSSIASRPSSYNSSARSSNDAG